MLQIQNKPGKHNPKRIMFKSPSTGSLNFPLRMKQYHTMLEGNKVTEFSHFSLDFLPLISYYLVYGEDHKRCEAYLLQEEAAH